MLNLIVSTYLFIFLSGISGLLHGLLAGWDRYIVADDFYGQHCKLSFMHDYLEI
jgi:hypothetical protein